MKKVNDRLANGGDGNYMDWCIQFFKYTCGAELDVCIETNRMIFVFKVEIGDKILKDF